MNLKVISRFKNRSLFVKGSFLLFIANVLSQTVNTLSLLLLARIYGIEDFGNFALFSSYTIVLSTLFTLKYDSALISMEPDERKLVVRFCIILYGFLIMGLLPGLFFSKNNIVYHAVFAALLISLFKIISNFFLSAKNFMVLFVFKVLSSVLFLIISIFVLRFVNNKSFGMINAYIFSYSIILLVMIVIIRKYIYELSLKSFKKSVEVIKRYINFPVYYLPQQMLNQMSNQMPIFFISFFFGNYYSGIFMMVMRLLSALPSMVASSVSQVFYQRLSELYQDGRYFHVFFYKVYRWLMILSPLLILSILLVIFFVEKQILPKSWDNVFYYSLLLAPMVTIRFIGSVVSFVILVLEYQKKSFYIEIVHLVGRFVVLVIGGFIHQFSLLLIALTLVSLVVTGYRLYWYKEIVDKIK